MRQELNLKWSAVNANGIVKPSHQEALSESVMERITTMMREGFSSGELVETIRMSDEDGEDGVAYHGWWSVSIGEYYADERA
jgi:uncharacterized protein YoaH (UPF0181 family)